jgi:hypothetical protein
MNSFKGYYPELVQTNLILKTHIKGLKHKLISKDKEIGKLKSELAFLESLRTMVHYN